MLEYSRPKYLKEMFILLPNTSLNMELKLKLTMILFLETMSSSLFNVDMKVIMKKIMIMICGHYYTIMMIINISSNNAVFLLISSIMFSMMSQQIPTITTGITN